MIRHLLLLGLLALAACQHTPDSAQTAAAQADAVQNGAPPATSPDTPAEAFLARPPDALVVDVRTPTEFASGHIVGAQNVDVNGGAFGAALDSVSRGRPVYLYCRSGSRSAKAADSLRAMGFTAVVNSGGFETLKGAGAETE